MAVNTARKPSKILIALLVMASVFIMGAIVAVVAIVKAVDDVGAAAGEADSAQQAYRNSGLPIVAAEVRKDGILLSKENAAGLLRQAIAKLPKGSVLTDTRDMKASCDSGDYSTADEKLAKYRDSMTLAERGSHLRGLDFDRDWDRGPDILFPEYAPIKGFGRLFAIRSQISASRGDAKNAIRDLQTAWNLAGLVAQEPTMISGLVGISIDRMVLDALQVDAYSLRDDPPALTRLQSFAEGLRDSVNPAIGMRGESYIGLATIRNLKNYGGVQAVLESGKSKPLDPSILVRSGLPTDKMSRAFAARHMQFWSRVADMMRENSSNQLGLQKALADYTSEVEGRKGVSNILLAALTDIYPKFIEASLEISAGRVADQALITALVDRARFGKLPARIDEIPGSYEDPFTGKPLLIKQSGDTIRIYSVGPNGKDSGGISRAELQSKDSKDWNIPACFPPIKPRKQAVGN